MISSFSRVVRFLVQHSPSCSRSHQYSQFPSPLNRLHNMSNILLGMNFCKTIASSAISKEMHSEEAMVEFPNLKVMIIPALSDNFMYLVIDKLTKKAFAVDPVQPELVLDVLKREGATLTSALITHHHWDHAGGNNKLIALHNSNHPQSSLKIYGGDDRIEGLNKKIKQDDTISVGSLKVTCLSTPCHTKGHICYFVNTEFPEEQKPIVFTGDTLFVAGCGRFFEGTAEEMHKALLGILGTLPADTLVFCGHEYTVANLKFVLSVDKDNVEAQLKYESAQNLRKVKRVTIPSTIGEELRSNIFMRCNDPKIQAAVGVKGAIPCMDKLRTMKNNF